MKLKILYSLIILFTLSNITRSQVQEEWVQRYDGPVNNGWDISYGVVTDNNGYVYVTGMSPSETGSGYATIKYSTTGGIIWTERYDGPGGLWQGWAQSIAIDNLGNVYVTGWAGSTNINYTTIKYNSDGVLQWKATYDGPANGFDAAIKIAVDNLGNVYVTGLSTKTNYDFTTVKYNTSGVQQWAARYNGTGNGDDIARDIKVDNSGNVFVTGFSVGTDNYFDMTTIKYSAAGVQEWVALYSATYDASGYALSISADGNICVTGGSLNSNGFDCTTVKYKNSGSQLWAAVYDGPAHSSDVGNSIVTDDYDNVYVGGYSMHGLADGTEDYLTIKYDNAGSQQWASIYNGPGDYYDIVSSIAIDNQSSDMLPNVYVTGESFGININSDYCAVKYNNSGVQQWVVRYDGPGNDLDVTTAITVDNLNNVYITGTSVGSGTSSQDYATIKYSQNAPCCNPSGVKNVSNNKPINYKLYQNYPNPFNPATIIKFDIPKKSFVNLAIYDVLGHGISLLIDNIMEAGSYEYQWDAGKYPSGIYFYNLKTDTFSKTNKMALVK